MRSRAVKVRNLIIHILFLTVLFIGSVLYFERLINKVAPDAAELMENSTFPLVYMKRGNVSFNCLHGYAYAMDPSTLRDSITPLSTNREIVLAIQTFSTSIESVSYRVCTLDGTQTLENTQVISLEKDGDYQNATIRLQNNMLMNQEYMLEILVKSGGRSIYYYTHVLLADGLHADDYLNFVTGFYDKTVNRTNLTSVGAAVEPDETTDAEQTLSFMDIHDSVNQLTWANLQPQIYYKPTPRITEINENTATLTMEYRIASVNGDGVTEVFNVRESYRVRYTDSRVFLLDFERTTGEIFNPENHVLDGEGICLGITGKDVEYLTDEKSRVIAFVQENELWTYERSTSKLTQVFSFPQKENMDYRDFQRCSDIRILKVETGGDVWFVVDGYMNRGSHEGENGVALYHYESDTDMVDEKVFLRSMENASSLERDVDLLSYISDDGMYFTLLLEEQLYRINLSTRTYEILADHLYEDCCTGSSRGRFFAWLEEGIPYGSSVLNQIDLETRSTVQVNAPKGEKVRPVCYMGEDLVYGFARDEEIAMGSLTLGRFPMYRLVIADGEGNEIKNYQPPGCFVTKVIRSDHMLSLERAAKKEDGTGLVSTSSDEIVSTDTSASVSTGISTRTTDRKQTIVYLRTGGEISDLTPEIIRSKIIKYSAPRLIEIPVNADRQRLYDVYAAGRLSDRFTDANEAVVYADAHVGVVIDGENRYIWVRGDKTSTAQILLHRVPEAMAEGRMDLEAIAKSSGGDALDLSGCTLDQVLYFVSHGRPVMAQTIKGPVTIVGYDEYNTHLLDPGGEEWYYYGINDSTQMFADAGNIFYSYVQ